MKEATQLLLRLKISIDIIIQVQFSKNSVNDDVTQEVVENWIAKREWQFCVEAGGKAVEALIKTLNGDNFLSSIEAARELGKIGDNKAVESLLVALADHDISTYFRDRNKNVCMAA